jgi:hypothetical protein
MVAAMPADVQAVVDDIAAVVLPLSFTPSNGLDQAHASLDKVASTSHIDR